MDIKNKENSLELEWDGDLDLDLNDSDGTEVSSDFTSGGIDLEDLGLEDIDLLGDTGTKPTEPQRKWNKTYFTAYLGLNYLTIYKEDIDTILGLIYLNQSSTKLKFLVDNLSDFQAYAELKYSENKKDLSDELRNQLELILDNVSEKISALKTFSESLYLNLSFINDHRKENIITILNDSKTSSEIITTFENSEWKTTPMELDRILNLIIVTMSLLNRLGTKEGNKIVTSITNYNRTSNSYTDLELEALEYIEAPTPLATHETIFKNVHNNDINTLLNDLSKPYFMKNSLALINLYYSRKYKLSPKYADLIINNIERVL